jgi:hypothetical protein
MARGVCAGAGGGWQMQQIDVGVCRIGGDFDICASGRRPAVLVTYWYSFDCCRERRRRTLRQSLGVF